MSCETFNPAKCVELSENSTHTNYSFAVLPTSNIDEDCTDNDPVHKTKIGLLRVDGSDADIAKAARMSRDSFDKKTTPEEDYELICNLMQWGHTTPFEFASVVVQVTAPIYIARQWFRHRTFSFMEKSGRYTDTEFIYYVPPGIDNLDSVDQVDTAIKACLEEAKEKEVPKQDQRSILPLGTITKFIFKADMHNMLHFLQLRMSNLAQPEMAKYAHLLCMELEGAFPLTMRAFKNIWLGSKRVSRYEQEIIRKIIKNQVNPVTESVVLDLVNDTCAKHLNENEKLRIVNNIIKFIG